MQIEKKRKKSLFKNIFLPCYFFLFVSLAKEKHVSVELCHDPISAEKLSFLLRHLGESGEERKKEKEREERKRKKERKKERKFL